jgi:polysaccharide pyruvyl transferase WcaK-like protein
MIHGSGSGFGARSHLAAFHRATGKPCGVLGTSVDPISGFGGDRDPEGGTLANLRGRAEKLPRTHLDKETRWIIDRAAFMFTRETISRDYLRLQAVRTPILEFGPDTQFGMTLRDDARGDAYRAANGLEDGKFLCIIPRLRYTPYYEVFNRPRNKADYVRDAINERSVEADHAKLREVIIRYVRETGNRVMTCPEMTYQASLAKRAVIDPLPDDVKKHVVWRSDFWLPDEAAAIYAKAQAVISLDCHSPIIALVNGTPAFYVRQPTDTCKGEMYRDIGVGDWLFEIEETTGAEIWSRLETVLNNPAAARAKIDAAMKRVHQSQRRMVTALTEPVS